MIVSLQLLLRTMFEDGGPCIDGLYWKLLVVWVQDMGHDGRFVMKLCFIFVKIWSRKETLIYLTLPSLSVTV